MRGLQPSVVDYALPHPKYHVTGYQEFLKPLQSEVFQRLLGTLMAEANITSSIVIVGNRKVMGTGHSKGLQLKGHHATGIEMTWHDPDKDNGHNIAFMIRTPTAHFTHSEKFHECVTTAFNALAIRQRVVAPPESADTPSATQATSSSIENPTQEAKKATSNGSTSNKVDDDNGELIVMECAKFAGKDGRVTRRKIVELLNTLQFSAKGPAMRSLLANGHFDPCADSEDFLLIGARWKEKYLPQVSEPATSTPRVSVAAEVADGKTTVAPAETTAAKPEALQVRVARLQKNLASAKKMRARLDALNREKSQVAEIMRPYAEQMARLETEEASLKAELEKPEFKEAEAKLAAVNAALG